MAEPQQPTKVEDNGPQVKLNLGLSQTQGIVSASTFVRLFWKIFCSLTGCADCGGSVVSFVGVFDHHETDGRLAVP